MNLRVRPRVKTYTKYDNLFLKFTTARLITNYDNLLLQFTIAWLLQLITILNNCYNSEECYCNSRQLLNVSYILFRKCKVTRIIINFDDVEIEDIANIKYD